MANAIAVTATPTLFIATSASERDERNSTRSKQSNQSDVCRSGQEGRLSQHQGLSAMSGHLTSPRELAHRARRLLDLEMSVGVAARVGIRDGNPAHALARLRQHVVVIVAIEQRVGDIAVAVRPAVDGDRCDITPAREPAWSQHAVELVADPDLEISKGRFEQLP